MKIVAIVRTRDEESRIAQFCEAYREADRILVGDGGSIDRTVEIAQAYPNVEVRHFPEKTILDSGHWRNNDSKHMNWLISWAKEHEPDWIISDDCDCRPNYLLKQQYRDVFEKTDADFVQVVRLYVWLTDSHFPHMAKPYSLDRERWSPSLWAWRGSVDFWTVDAFPHFTFRIGDKPVLDLASDARVFDIMLPACLIHYSWDNAERVERKVRVHRESGSIPTQLHPLEFAGLLEPLPEWAHD